MSLRPLLTSGLVPLHGGCLTFGLASTPAGLINPVWRLFLVFSVLAKILYIPAKFHPVFGPILMVTYACLSNTLLLTGMPWLFIPLIFWPVATWSLVLVSACPFLPIWMTIILTQTLADIVAHVLHHQWGCRCGGCFSCNPYLQRIC